MQKKAIKTTKLADGTIRLSAETFEEVLDFVFKELKINSEYERSYPSRDWYDPPEYASMTVDAYAKISTEKFKEHFETTDDFFELLDDVFTNYDCLEYEDCEEIWKKFIESIKEEIYSSVPAYTVDSYSASISIKDDVVVFTFEVDDYSFDEYEYIEAGRPKPDPYDYY